MNRNNEIRLNELPKVNIQRSIFNIPFGHKTSFNVGQVIPFYVQEILPASTHNIKTSVVARLQTLLAPIMDNLYLDTYYYFVPNRLVLDTWKNIMGENTDGPWTMDKVDYEVPYLKYPKYGLDSSIPVDCPGFEQGSIADYMGVPINVNDTLFHEDYTSKDMPSALPFRGYAMIINEFFRDQNLQQPVVIHKDNVIRVGRTITMASGYTPNYVTDLELGGAPFVAARFHDYFSSCLPAPQKSQDVSIFGGFNTGDTGSRNTATGIGPFAPVVTRSEAVYYNGPGNVKLDPAQVPMMGYISDGNNSWNVRSTQTGTIQPNAAMYLSGTLDSGNGFAPSNLWASLNIPEATISQLRLAFQTQKYFEKMARGGSRYREYLAEMFGCYNGDARMQVPEYLGGHRIPLSIHQVANTSETETAKLGDLGAMSNTSDVHDDVHMSFSEHGFLFGLAVVRYDNTYSQGLERFWSRRTALDYYNPVFANISEQPVFARELSLGLADELGAPQSPDRVFGYQQPWADYRYKPNRCSSEMRPEASNSLATWHLADDYQSAPYLSSEWIQTDKNIVDRVLSVTSEVANQVFADFFVMDKAVLPMPVHSIPGLVDHH